jgi:ABC-type cobalamin/Fe3+-siderophores transport system ATPase subunit
MDMVRRYADRVILLNQTILKVGTPDEVLDSQTFSEVFRLPTKSCKEEGKL